MGGLFELIHMRSRTEGASPPENMDRMHADLQIEVEKRLLVNDLKRPVWHAQCSIFFSLKNDRFASPEWSPIN